MPLRAPRVATAPETWAARGSTPVHTEPAQNGYSCPEAAVAQLVPKGKFLFMHPLATSHESVVHSRVSLQSCGAGVMHLAAWHVGTPWNIRPLHDDAVPQLLPSLST